MTGRQDHERARELAAARPDGFLTPAEAAWLDAHLAACDDCTAIDAAYAAQRSLFDVARGAYPETPRDLWARTAAEIERGGGRRGARRFGRPTLAYAPLAGALVVAIAVGAGLLNGLPAQDSTSKGEEPEATPFALAAGEVQVVSRAEDGSLQLRRQPVAEVCPVGAESCGLKPAPVRTTTELQTTATTFDAIISPDEEQVVVVERGDGAQGVFVVDVTDPEVAALPGDVPALSPAAASSSPEPTASVEPTASPDASPSTEPTESASTVEPRTTPTPEATTRPTPSVGITPLPDGAIEIASNVEIVGNTAAYSPDGKRFAFSARRVKGSAGPDVFVWTVGDARALAVTSDHVSLFAGWLGSDETLVSRVTGGEARTAILALDTGDETPASDGAMWRPAVGPDAASGVWWDGTVAATTNGLGWTPENGRLVLGSWPADGTQPQVLARTGLTDWQAEWDGTGRLLAVWTSTAAAGKPGELSLYAVNRRTGRADLARPKLDKAPAYAGFSIRNGRLTWSAPAAGGDRTVQVLAWKGDTFGRFEILSDGSTTVVR